MQLTKQKLKNFGFFSFFILICLLALQAKKDSKSVENQVKIEKPMQKEIKYSLQFFKPSI
ncbi:MAG: hypothetical protein DWP98_04585 [Bacteroidetes bacterium]|nr:MAG: hypothetical protein DWP98_04585 [Bacteroidota bacterium]MBL1144665.1 hypothetical protein [Bacteroidota bacterium]